MKKAVGKKKKAVKAVAVEQAMESNVAEPVVELVMAENMAPEPVVEELPTVKLLADKNGQNPLGKVGDFVQVDLAKSFGPHVAWLFGKLAGLLKETPLTVAVKPAYGMAISIIPKAQGIYKASIFSHKNDGLSIVGFNTCPTINYSLATDLMTTLGASVARAEAKWTNYHINETNREAILEVAKKLLSL